MRTVAMRNLILFLFLSWPCFGQWATNGFGWNFRGTLAYVTDPAHTTVVKGASAAGQYPQTATVDGVVLTFGWLTAGMANVGQVDRTTAGDHRLAGINYMTSGGASDRFRVDLPATGSYTINLALGDGGATNVQWATFDDNGTVFATVAAGVSTSTGHFLDATGVDRTAAAWPGSNAPVTHTFTSTVFQVNLGGGSAFSTLAHLYVLQNASAAAPARHRIINQ